jgi:spore photoproduct lyase
MGKQVRQDFRPQKILVEETIQGLPFVQQILSGCANAPIEIIPDANQIIRAAQEGENRERWQGSLLLAKQRGPFLRLCPGTPRHICCMYHNLDVAAGCDLDCSYCILQAYLNTPLVTLYCNLDDLFLELSQSLSSHPDQFFRIGTGELTDSLTFDHLTGLSRELVRFFANRPNAIIELKTKSVRIENILGIEHNRRTVVSWSLNSQAISNKEESGAPGIDERLAAAQEVQNAGYRLGFHFDPMIDHPGWEEGYRDTVDRLFRFARPENIAWISLGALRYPPALEEFIRKNHPVSPIVLGELLPGVDKKLRYFKPIRVEMFRKMYQWIRSYSQDVFVYLCMESDEVWRKAFGWSPGNSGSLKTLLDDRAKGR